ncbi:MAG: DUF2784 domain-containing protein [Acidobacteria bacterium]|nr:DUF2784 domain-containing protein [Acidobacteriota bacterium]
MARAPEEGDVVIYRAAADTVVLVHLAFILFVVAGGVPVLKWPKLAWIHLPAVAWGALVEFTGWICPLTPLENNLRIAAGGLGYSGGFVERYLIPVVYPPSLTRTVQFAIGATVLAINAGVYTALLLRKNRHSS